MTTISLTVLDDDLGTADRLARELRAELLGLDVDAVDLVVDRDVPAGAKSDAATVTAIVVAVSGSPVLLQLGMLLRDWVNRANSRRIVARDGDRSLEIFGPTTAQTSKVIDEFFDRPE